MDYPCQIPPLNMVARFGVTKSGLGPISEPRIGQPFDWPQNPQHAPNKGPDIGLTSEVVASDPATMLRGVFEYGKSILGLDFTQFQVFVADNPLCPDILVVWGVLADICQEAAFNRGIYQLKAKHLLRSILQLFSFRTD